MTRYLLDANVFIQAKNFYYGFDLCPGFWEWVLESNAKGTVFSIEKVGSELVAGSDDLAAWAEARGDGFFVPPTAAVVPAFGTVSNWVTGQAYEPAAISTYLNVADYYLVAQALAEGSTVVTHEIPADSKRKIKIPNVCLGVGVKYVTPYEMLRRERAQFVLARPA